MTALIAGLLLGLGLVAGWLWRGNHETRSYRRNRKKGYVVEEYEQ